MADAPPDPGRCSRAIKILEQFERLSRKLGIRLTAARLQDLRGRRDAGTIKSTDVPAKLQREFPGEFAGMTLDAIRARCGRS